MKLDSSAILQFSSRRTPRFQTFFQRFYRFLWFLVAIQNTKKRYFELILIAIWRDNFWLNARSRNTVIRMKSYFQYSMGYLGPFQILTKGKSSKIKLRISIRHIFVILGCQWWNVIDVSTDLFDSSSKMNIVIFIRLRLLQFFWNLDGKTHFANSFGTEFDFLSW